MGSFCGGIQISVFGYVDVAIFSVSMGYPYFVRLCVTLHLHSSTYDIMVTELPVKLLVHVRNHL